MCIMCEEWEGKDGCVLCMRGGEEKVHVYYVRGGRERPMCIMYEEWEGKVHVYYV